jgi:hypothetical protein
MSAARPAKPQRVIGIVRGHDQGSSVRRQGAHDPQRQHLIAEIEMRGRLVDEVVGCCARIRASRTSWRSPPLSRV